MKMRGTGKGNGVKHGNTFNAGVGSVVVSGAGREESQGWWEGWLLKGWKTQDPYTRAAL